MHAGRLAAAVIASLILTLLTPVVRDASAASAPSPSVRQHLARAHFAPGRRGATFSPYLRNPVMAVRASLKKKPRQATVNRVLRHAAAARTRAGSSRLATPGVPIGGTWTALGPQPIPTLSTYGNVSGRVTALAVDPTNQATVFAGTAGGGVWRSTDSGGSWAPVTDGQPTLAISGLSIDPNNHLIIYAATGEDNRCGDCEASQGILKSTDGGNTWTLLGQGIFAVNQLQMGPIVVDRTNSAHLLVGTNEGLYQSSDGGTTWTANASLRGLSTIYFPDVDSLVQDPTNPSRFWAGVGEGCFDYGFIAVSSDGGSTWRYAVRMSAFAGFPRVDRIGLAVAANGAVYAAPAACYDRVLNYQAGEAVAILKSTNTGAGWQVITSSTGLLDWFQGGPSTFQGDYDNVVAADPTDTTGNTVVFGGVTMLVTQDGGKTFTDVARPYSGGAVHPDFHAVAFTAAKSFYTGNDGGIWSTTDLGGTGTGADWHNLNATLAITQFYDGSILDSTHLAGGSQDNGTLGMVGGSTWTSLLSGDGVNAVLDPTAGSTTLWAGRPYLTLYQESYTNSSGAVDVSPCPGPGSSDPACSDPAAFVAPFALAGSRLNATQRLYAGSNRVYSSLTAGIRTGTSATGGTWQALSGDLTTGTSLFPGGDVLTAMAAPSVGNVITGSFGGKVFFMSATHSPGNFQDVTGSLPAYNYAAAGTNPWITGVAMSPSTDNVTYDEKWVTIGGLGVGRVWESHNGQAAWRDITGTGLPNVAVTALAVDLAHPSVVYVGTDGAGAFVCSTCGGGTTAPPMWSSLGTGLTTARIDSLSLSPDGSQILAWTHGRGAWLLGRPALASTAVASPTALDFGTATRRATSNSRQVTLQNTGQGLVTLGSPTISGTNAGDFIVQPLGCGSGFQLVPGASCTYSVVFAPSSQSGPKTATVSLPSDASNGTQTVALTGVALTPTLQFSPPVMMFGPTASGATSARQTLTVLNTGPGILDFYTSGQMGDLTNFTGISTTCSAVLLVQQYCQIVVEFTPRDATTHSTSMSFIDNADSGNGTQTVQLIGNGPTFSTDPTANPPWDVPFGNTPVGTPVSQTVTVTNSDGNGSSTITFGSGAVTVADTTDFQISSDSCSGHTLADGQSCPVTVTFNPATPRPYNSWLNLADNLGTQQLPLTGTGTTTTPAVLINPSSVNFGSTNIGSPLVDTIAVTNVGSANLVFSDISTTGDFGTANNICSTAIPVAPGQSCQINVDFAPSATGLRTGTLTITDNAPTALSQQTINLTGTGTSPAISYSPSSLTFGNQLAHTTSQWQTLTMTNTGNGPLSIASYSYRGPFSSTQCGTTVLVAGASCTLLVTFAPQGAGVFTGSFSITVTPPQVSSNPSVSLSGTGSAPVLSGSNLTFGSQPIGVDSTLPLTITNSGTGADVLNSVSTTGDFYEQDSCVGQLNAGSSCVVGVIFVPSAAGPRTGSVTLTDASGNNTTFQLSGSGVSPPSTWQPLGGIIESAPPAASWPTTHVNVFARGSDNALWYRSEDNGNWSGWASLGGYITADPAAISWGSGRIDVFVRGGDGHLYQKTFNGTSWSGWIGLGGISVGGPGVSSWMPGQLVLFVRGQDNALWFQAFDGKWEGWHSLGGILSAEPAATSANPGQIDIFVTGGNKALYQKEYSNGTWTGWIGLGGIINGGPAAASWGGGRLDVFVRGGDNAMYHKVFDPGSGWGGWIGLGGLMTADPGAVAQAVGLIDLFVRGTDSALWYRSVSD